MQVANSFQEVDPASLAPKTLAPKTLAPRTLATPQIREASRRRLTAPRQRSGDENRVPVCGGGGACDMGAALAAAGDAGSRSAEGDPMHSAAAAHESSYPDEQQSAAGAAKPRSPLKSATGILRRQMPRAGMVPQ